MKDTGIGMSRDTVTRIFDKFYQCDHSHTTTGNGLGLSLVKRIIELVGGEISVRSELGRGSEFRVCCRRRRNPPKKWILKRENPVRSLHISKRGTAFPRLVPFFKIAAGTPFDGSPAALHSFPLFSDHPSSP